MLSDYGLRRTEWFFVKAPLLKSQVDDIFCISDGKIIQYLSPASISKLTSGNTCYDAKKCMHNPMISPLDNVCTIYYNEK